MQRCINWCQLMSIWYPIISNDGIISGHENVILTQCHYEYSFQISTYKYKINVKIGLRSPIDDSNAVTCDINLKKILKYRKKDKNQMLKNMNNFHCQKKHMEKMITSKKSSAKFNINNKVND